MNAEELHAAVQPLVERAVRWAVRRYSVGSMTEDLEQELWLYVYGRLRTNAERHLEAGNTETIARDLRRQAQRYAEAVQEIQAMEIDLGPDDTVWLADRTNTDSSSDATS